MLQTHKKSFIHVTSEITCRSRQHAQDHQNRLYGEVDEEKVEEQTKLLFEVCPILSTFDEKSAPKVPSGEGFYNLESFYVTGDDTKIPFTKPEGSHSENSMRNQQQGYKIHVSAHPEHVGDVAQAIVPLFRQTSNGDNPLGGVYYKISHVDKYVNSKDEQQRGKFITIYAKDEQQLKEIAVAVQNQLRKLDMSPEIYGGGLAPGDSKLGPQEEKSMMSMRWGQFFGVKTDQVYVNGEFIFDKRSIPCPEVMKDTYQNMLNGVNQHMEENKRHFILSLDDLGISDNNNNNNNTVRSSLGEKPQKLDTRSQLLSTSTSRTISNSNSISNLDTEKTIDKGTESTEVQKKETKTVGDSFKQHKQSGRRNRMQMDHDTMKEILKGNFRDPDPDGDDKGKKITGPSKTKL